MVAKDFRKVILFMANRWSEEMAVTIYGERLGKHIYGKWIDGGTFRTRWSPDEGTMSLFYELDNETLQVLLDYIDNNYKG